MPGAQDLGGEHWQAPGRQAERCSGEEEEEQTKQLCCLAPVGEGTNMSLVYLCVCAISAARHQQQQKEEKSHLVCRPRGSEQGERERERRATVGEETAGHASSQCICGPVVLVEEEMEQRRRARMSVRRPSRATNDHHYKFRCPSSRA